MNESELYLRPLSACHARLRVQGPDARRFLHGMVSNDIQGLKTGQGCHACLLSVKGKLIGDPIVYDCGEAGLLLSMVAAARAGVYASLDRHLIMDNAAVEDLTHALAELAVYGREAAAALADLTPLGSAADLQALPRHGLLSRGLLGGPDSPPGSFCAIAAAPPLRADEPAFHVHADPAQIAALRAALLTRGARERSEAEADLLRIESGIPEYGRDLDEDRRPAEAGLDDAVSYNKGCYLGQEVVVRLRDRGHLNRKLCGLRIADDGPVPPAGSKLRSADKPQAGSITSTARSPRFGTIALAYVHRTAWDVGTRLELLAPDDQPTGRTAVLCALPFAN